jgi:hypothetical protein
MFPSDRQTSLALQGGEPTEPMRYVLDYGRGKLRGFTLHREAWPLG